MAANRPVWDTSGTRCPKPALLLRALQCRDSRKNTYGEGGIRTRDTTIFSRVLYQLSYLAWKVQAAPCSAKASDRGATGLIAFGR